MFTGIVREVGRVQSLRSCGGGAVIAVEVKRVSEELQCGDSVAVNGVCLTCEERDANSFTASLLHETLKVTNLGKLRSGSKVNIEPPLKAGDPIGGHFLQGHVDAKVRVSSFVPAGSREDASLICELPERLKPFVFPGASIGLNGVSLTVRSASDSTLKVNLIPTTLEETNLGELRSGDYVNAEVDLIIKTVYHTVQGRTEPSNLSANSLRELGYD